MKLLSSLLLTTLLLASFAFAEIKTFDVDVEETVSRNQSQEAVEAFALQKAKRLAVEQAGTYLSSMKVVERGRLGKEEIMALASGIVRSKILKSDAVVKNGQVKVQVTARVEVDSAVLEKQIEAILKDRSLLKKLEEKDQKLRALEEELSKVQSAEVKRLQELNAQAVALEMAREKQRLFLEEQRLKAQGDIAKAELKQLREERERADKFENLRKEQEAARQKELATISREQDRIKKAQLENEANAAELARTAELARANWVTIDDRLSANQAKEEAESIRAEIARLIKKLDDQHQKAEENLQNAYKKQIAATKPILPAPPAEKDPFETTAEYNKRLADYKAQAAAADTSNDQKIEQLETEEKVKLAELKVQSSERKLEILKPFVTRLGQLQEQVFVLPRGSVTTDLQAPQADKNRFPLNLTFNGKTYSTYWDYKDRDKARLFYQTRSHLLAEPVFKLQPGNKTSVDFVFAGARVAHPGTNEKRDLLVSNPTAFAEIGTLESIQNRLPAERYAIERAKWKIIDKDGSYIAYDNGVVEDTRTKLEWVVGPDKNTDWNSAYSWTHLLQLAGGGWRMPTRSELKGLYQRKKGSRNMTPLLKTTGWYIWSNEKAGSSSAWLFDFDCGRGYRRLLGDAYDGHRAFAVRSRSNIIESDKPEGTDHIDGLKSQKSIRNQKEKIPLWEGQIWKGYYVCGQGKTSLKIKIKEIKGSYVKAIFDFNFKNGRATGEFYLEGKFDSKTRKLSFIPGEWIKRPSGYGTVGMDGYISNDGLKYIGKISGGCKEFDLALTK